MRTQGRRESLFLQALQSVALQTERCLAVVVVHNTEEVASQVRRLCASVPGLEFEVLQAADLRRGRAYPLNIALAWCYTQVDRFTILTILDDDDLLYPFFAREMRMALVSRGSEIVYCSSNRRTNGIVSTGYGALPFPAVFRENFIPINAIAYDFAALCRERLFFDETIEYAEDWRFLLECLAHGFRLEYHPRVLCEFMVATDGNQPTKSDSAQWKACSLAIRQFINTQRFPIPGSLLTSLALTIDPNIPARDEMVYHLERNLDLHRQEIQRLGAELKRIEMGKSINPDIPT